MISRVATATVYVDDQDEALAFYTSKLGFEKRSDVTLPNGFRWLTVGAPGQPGFALTLERVSDSSRGAEVGTGRNSTFVLYTTDIDAALAELTRNGVPADPVTDRPYGRETVLRDLYGNPYALVEPK
jgi:catechol 2,3-dioxygenase-like lactoylglutathione lyase family enzyme